MESQWFDIFFPFRFSNFLPSSKASETEESENSDFNNSDDDDSSDDDDDTDEDDIDTQPKFEPLEKEKKSTIQSGKKNWKVYKLHGL